jgi:ATP-dependent DNA ligase
LRIFLDGGAA